MHRRLGGGASGFGASIGGRSARRRVCVIGVSMVNKVILLGNMGQDPQTRTTPNGNEVATLRIATSEKFKDKSGEMKERTEWTTVVVWGKQAESCSKYLTKGRQVYVEGRLSTRKWTDKDGIERLSTEVIAETVKFLGGDKKQEGGDAAYGRNPW